MRQQLLRLCIVAGTALAATSAAAQNLQEPTWWSGGWGHMTTSGIMMIVVWGGLIVLAVVLGRYLSNGTAENSNRSSAIEILQQRFARGEIDQQEYEARRRALTEPLP